MSSVPSLHPILTQLVVAVMARLVPGMPLGDVRKLSVGARVPHPQANKMLKIAVLVTGRADLGLLAAEAAEPGHFELVEFAARTQSTLGEAIETLQNLLPVLHDGAQLTLERGPERARSELRFGAGMRLHPAGYDFVVASFVVAARRQTGHDELQVSRIELPYSRPSGELPLARVIQCEFVFDAPCLAVEFPLTGLELPLMRRDPALGSSFRELAHTVVKRTVQPRSALETALREHVRAGLSAGDLSSAGLAHRLHVSERTLRRKLEAEGLRLRNLLDEERRELALELLRDERRSTDELAVQLGYSTAQAFHRAFRRWTGDTVQSHRARLRRR